MATDESTSRATATLVVTVSETCLTDERAINIELNEILNNDRTCFTAGQRVYIRVFPQPEDLDYTIGNTNGVIIADPGNDGLLEVEDEYVQITDGTGNLSYPLHSIDSIEWHGDAPCPLASVSYSVGQKAIQCSTGTCTDSPEDELAEGVCDVTYGVLKISYKSLFKSYYAIANEYGTILIYAYENLADDV